MSHKYQRKFLLFLLVLPLLFSCAENPVTKTKELMVFSEADEVRFGKNLDEEIRSKYGIYEEMSLKRYITEVGEKIASVSHRPHLNYSFDILDLDEVNAFALPGGFIYVTRGLLCYLKNEAQLAGVIAHEVGHVSYRHSMKALQRSIGANILLNIIALGTGSQFWIQISDIALNAIMAGYSREEENQADSLSVEYTLRSGYDPYQIRDFLKTISKIEGGRTGPLVGIFADHPLTEKRVRSVEEKIKERESELKGRFLTLKEEEYLQMIDGLPVQRKRGWVRDKGELINGNFGISIPFYRAFLYDRGSDPDELSIYDREGTFLIEVTPIKGKTPWRGAIEEYEKKKALGKKVSVQYFEKDNRIPICTYRTVRFEVKVAYIEFFPHTLAVSFTENGLSRGGLLFETLIQKARRLKEEEMARYAEERIKIYEIKERVSLKELYPKIYKKKDEKLLRKLAIINGVDPSDILEAGTKIKLITGGGYFFSVEENF